MDDSSRVDLSNQTGKWDARKLGTTAEGKLSYRQKQRDEQGEKFSGLPHKIIQFYWVAELGETF